MIPADEPSGPGRALAPAARRSDPAAQVTHLFEHYAREFKLGRQERIEWNGADGTAVEGLLHYPAD